jgi:hypothetical protein
MQIEINGNIEDISAMLLSAERYALGRRTYIVEWTCSFIAKNLHLVTESNKKVMIRDIKEQEKYGYGDKCDEENWMKLLKILDGDEDK